MPKKRPGWSEERRAKFEATIAKKKEGRIISLPKEKIEVIGMNLEGKKLERAHVADLREVTSLQNVVHYWRDKGAKRILITF